jgi:hypothetical protein
MKTLVKIFDRATNRFSRSLSFHRKRGDSFDVLELAFFNAALESARYYETHLLTSRSFDDDLALLGHALDIAPAEGLILEFGVASGRTISHIAGIRSQRIYGFDSFQGLPEDWRSGFGRGAFAGNLPPVPNNVELIVGWFDTTLRKFLEAHEGPVSFVHIDCDLYSSTKTILDLLEPRLREGSVLVFDEYWNYPGWTKHEHKAFEELRARSRLDFEPVGFVPSHQQVAFVVRTRLESK